MATMVMLSKRRQEPSSVLVARGRFRSANSTWKTPKPMNPRQQRHQTFPQDHGPAPMSPRPSFQVPLLPLGPLSLPEPEISVAKRTDSVSSEDNMHGFTLESQTTLRTWRTTQYIQDCLFGKIMLAVEVKDPALAGREGANAAAPPPVYFAIKEVRVDILKKKQEQGETLDDPLREVSMMQHIDIPHQNVVQCTEALRDEHAMYIVTPFYNGGELFDIWLEKRPFTEDEARSVLVQVLDALIHLKESGVCHRDVSMENLVMHDGVVKLIDLGAALRIPQTADGRAIVLPPQGSCGKKKYMAPEVILDKGRFDGFAADAWSLGVMLFEMVTGIPPFDTGVPSLDERCKVIAVQERLGELVALWKIPLSPEVVDLMQSCLRVDPANRATLETLRNHPWATG